MDRKGKFIVLDGIDGCGKGTQAKLLVDYLFDCDKKNHIFLTREPYNSEYYAEIRQLLKEGIDPKENSEFLAELFVKDRKVHCKLLEYLLSRGVYIVCDRYKYSTLVYQQAQGVSLEKLLEIHKRILIPDLAIIVDVPAEIALERVVKDGNRSHREVFEQQDFQEQLRQNFLALPVVLPDEKIIIIDGNKLIAEAFELIKKEVNQIF